MFGLSRASFTAVRYERVAACTDKEHERGAGTPRGPAGTHEPQRKQQPQPHTNHARHYHCLHHFILTLTE